MHDLTVLVAGATSASGTAVSRALVAAGATVVGVSSNEARLAAFENAVPGAVGLVCDLSDPVEVLALRDEIVSRHGRLDALIHLVGGWRGGGALVDQSDGDWDVLQRMLVGTLRNTTRAFVDLVAASTAGRVAIVSSTAVDRPTAGNANYAAAKAAAESWMRSLAEEFERRRGGAGAGAAAVTFAVKALVDDTMRAAAPERRFPGYTDVDALASAVVGLWAEGVDAAALNGSRVPLV